MLLNETRHNTDSDAEILMSALHLTWNCSWVVNPWTSQTFSVSWKRSSGPLYCCRRLNVKNLPKRAKTATDFVSFTVILICSCSDIVATGCNDKCVRVFYMPTPVNKELKKFTGTTSLVMAPFIVHQSVSVCVFNVRQQQLVDSCKIIVVVFF